MSMQSIMAASQSLVKMQTLQSAGRQMQSNANILRIESKQDGGDKEKLEKADALEEKSSNLMDDLMGEANEVNETLRPDEDAEAGEKEENREKDPKTDKVTLSDYANGYKGTLPVIHPVAEETAAYKADGSKAPDTLANAAPAFETTV